MLKGAERTQTSGSKANHNNHHANDVIQIKPRHYSSLVATKPLSFKTYCHCQCSQNNVTNLLKVFECKEV